MSVIGVPLKVLHEAEGHIITVETNTGNNSTMSRQGYILCKILWSGGGGGDDGPSGKMKKVKEKRGKIAQNEEKGLKYVSFWVLNSKTFRGVSTIFEPDSERKTFHVPCRFSNRIQLAKSQISTGFWTSPLNCFQVRCTAASWSKPRTIWTPREISMFWLYCMTLFKATIDPLRTARGGWRVDSTPLDSPKDPTFFPRIRLSRKNGSVSDLKSKWRKKYIYI